IVAVNPLVEAGLVNFRNPQRPRGLVGRGTALADTYLQDRVGTDLALFQWINRRLLELDTERGGGVVDREFVDGSCDVFDALADHLRELDPAELAAAAGLPV